MSDAEERDPGRETDDEDETTDEEEDDMVAKTNAAASSMKDVFNNEASKDDLDQFMMQHSEVIKYIEDGGTTFLHKIVNLVSDRDSGKPINALYIKPLVEKIMQLYPDFLRSRNDESQTPLYRAIYLKKFTWNLVEPMLNSCSNHQVVEDALEATCGKGVSLKTCLTLAFEKDLKVKALQNLIKHASEKALELTDGSGMSPFHLAVQYGQCDDKRVGIVKLLLQKDDAALRRLKEDKSFEPVETFLDLKYKRSESNVKYEVEYSVYTEHERSLEAYLESERKKESQAMPREAPLNQANGKGPNVNNPIRDKDPPKPLSERGPKSQSTVDYGDGNKYPDKDRERGGKESDKLDENERERQRLRAEEEKELKRKEEQENKARVDRRQMRYQGSDRDSSRTRQPWGKEAPYDATQGIPKIAAVPVGSDHAPNTPLKRVSTNTLNVDREKKKISTKSVAKKPDPETLAKNSAKILKTLKLHYMRTRSIKMATSFLYGKNNLNDIQICFDYEGLPSEIHDNVFMERFGKDHKSGIRFDEVLMYVRFPYVTVIRNGRKAPQPRALGRQDMEFFFHWLYHKGVRRILKVEVDDSGKIPHSDESICNALDKIIVEHLDWSKTDLDPRIICRISSKAETSNADLEGKLAGTKNELQELTLKWSGNNAVLRSWSELEGLPQLPKLQAINLSIPAQADLFDSRTWVQSNLEEFRVRLNQSASENYGAKQATDSKSVTESETTTASIEEKNEKPNPAPQRERKIEVFVQEGKKGTEIPVSSNSVPKSTERLNPITEHEWLNCMERFAGCMNVFWKETLQRSEENVKKDNNGNHLLSNETQNLDDLRKDVVVALIDDGVDSCDPTFSGRIIEGKTFDYRDRGVGQYYISARGHGTEMARMILKVCPMASIYSIRLKTHINPDKGQATIDATSAALAIEAALEKKATVISMSWTLPIPEDGSEEKALLDRVLERACAQKVLMFCSSSDQINATQHYPSAFRRHRFFLIGAAHDDGTAFGHAGKNNDFIFPGVNVNTASGTSLPSYLAHKTSSTKESTGSSIATALAAGLSAVILYCFKASALGIATARIQQGKNYVAGSELVRQTDVERIADRDVLKTAFNRIGKMESGQFIQVWDRFDPASQILEAEVGYEKKLTCIMNLCSNLIER
ncbi:hypothetical protein ACHAQJ_009913 [Trichoderma viride]